MTLVTATGVFVYYTQKDKHPGAQSEFDPEKKTVVVLGSGWGATNLLKTLDTEDYNVVSWSGLVKFRLLERLIPSAFRWRT